MPATRSTDQIDHDLHVQRNMRQALQQQIDSTTIRLRALRADYAKTGPAIERLLDERNLATHICPDTPAELDNPGTPA